MEGLDYLGSHAPLVDCVQRGEEFARTGRLATVGSLADYSFGENQVIQMNQYFNSLGRPKEFEAAAQAIWASYENLRSNWAALAYIRGDGMKQLGTQAAALTAQMQAAAAKKAQATGGVAPPVPPVAPPAPDKQTYDPTKPSEGILSKIPTWGWVLGGVGVLAAVAVPALPAIMSAVAASRLRK